MENVNTQIVLTQDQQNAWLGLAQEKNKVSAQLTKQELELQSLLMNVEDKNLDVQLAAYRKKHTELIEDRRKFTNVIDEKLIQSMMQFEKRSDPKTNIQYKDASTRELNYRKQQQEDLNKQKNEADENAAFKSHFLNQFNNIATDYRTKCNNVITRVYADCLYAKTPADAVQPAIDIAIKVLNELQQLEPAKYERKYISVEEAKKIFSAIPQPNFNDIKNEYIEKMRENFSLYENDLANAEAAAKRIETQAVQENTQLQNETQQENAQTTIIETAAAYQTPPEGFKGVTEVSRIQIIDNDPTWVLKIITAFLTNFTTCFPKVRVSKYSQLKIEQMCAALDAASIKVKDVQYENLQK